MLLLYDRATGQRKTALPKLHSLWTGSILKNSTPRMPWFVMQLIFHATKRKFILEKMPSSKKEQNRQNQLIMTNIQTEAASVWESANSNNLRHETAAKSSVSTEASVKKLLHYCGSCGRVDCNDDCGRSCIGSKPRVGKNLASIQQELHKLVTS